MSRFLLRTGLNSTRLLFSRLQLNCAPSNAALAVVAPSPPPPPAKSQSAWMHHGAYESMLKSAKLFPLSLELSTKSDDNSSGSSLEKKAIEIQSTRNSNPFNIYFKEKYKQTAQSNPKSTNKEVFSMLATSWRSLKMDEKLKYVEAAKENQRKTKSELEKFYSSMSTEEANSVMQTLKQKRSERRKELSKIRIKREQRSMNKPKPPPGAFFLYCKSLDRGEANIKEFIKGASMKWKALAQQDKQKYVDENKALVDEYQQKLKDWETRMVSEGRVKLVRAKFRQTLEKKLRKPSGPKTGARGLKLARKLKLKKLRAQARRARQARVAREKRERAKKALKARQAKMELNKARKLVELATKIKLSALKKTLDDSTTAKKKKTSGSDRKAAPKPPKFKDDEIVSHEKPDKTN